MDMLLLSAVAEAAQACVAFSNGWRYGAPIPPGPVTMNDLWNIIPSNPPVSITDLTGAEIAEMLEDNLENTFAADPYTQMGGYVKRCLGVKIYAKIENPKGARIQQLFVEGEPVRADRTYRAAFVTVQGVPKQFGGNRSDLGIRALDALRKYLLDHSPVEIGHSQSVIAV